MKNKKPHISEVREYFKDAETIKSCISDSVYEINTEVLGIYFDGYNYRQNTDSEERELLLWEENQGYAKILTYKTPKFEITKETVIKYQMKEEFPEVFEVKLPNDFTGWVLDEESPKIIAYSKKGFLKYGFNFYGKWIENTNTKIKHERKATPEEVTEALKKEAVRRYKVGDYVHLNGFTNYLSEKARISMLDEMVLWTNENQVDGAGVILFKNGQWATVIQTKTIQQAEELLKKLGHEIKIV